jgi:hypothetical protein
MNIDQVVETLDQFVEQLPRSLGNFALTSGAALVVHGVRDECNDIDIQVDEEVWATLEWRFGAHLQYIHGFPAFLSFVVGPAGDQYKVKITNTRFPTTKIDGINVQTLDSIYRAKEVWGRRKDVLDLDIIAAHLEEAKES